MRPRFDRAVRVTALAMLPLSPGLRGLGAARQRAAGGSPTFGVRSAAQFPGLSVP